MKRSGLARAHPTVILDDDDAAASMRLTEQAVREAPHAQLRRYPGGHFSAYSGDVIDRIVADEVAFLSEHLRAQSSAAS